MSPILILVGKRLDLADESPKYLLAVHKTSKGYIIVSEAGTDFFYDLMNSIEDYLSGMEASVESVKNQENITVITGDEQKSEYCLIPLSKVEASQLGIRRYSGY